MRERYMTTFFMTIRSLEEIKHRYGVDDPVGLADTLADLATHSSDPNYDLLMEAIIHTVPNLVKMVEERDVKIEELEMQARLRGGG